MDMVVREKKKGKKGKKSRTVASEMCEGVNMREIKKWYMYLSTTLEVMCTCHQLLRAILELIQKHY